MNRLVATVGVALAVILLVADVAPGDIIHLRNGKVEGIILQRTETELVVETTAGKVTIRASDVVRIERKPSPLELYRDLAKDVKDDADGHYKLGLWCLDAKLFRQANDEFRRAIAIDSDHAGARQRLGYVRRGGQWLTRSEAKRAEGLVRHEGRWVTEDQKAKAELREAVIAWRKRFHAAVSTKPLREDVLAARIARLLGDRKSEAADAALRIVLRDLIKEAQDEKRDRTYQARIALVEHVADQRSDQASELLRWTTIADPDDAVRSAAVQALRAQDSVDNTAYFVGLLRHYTGARYRLQGTKKLRNVARGVLLRAAQALADLEDPKAVPALANAMVVQFHIPEQQREDELPPMNLGFSATKRVGSTVITDQHGNQFVIPITEGADWNWGDQQTQPKVEDGFFFNDAAYNALRKLTGKDFGHDKRKWLAWWYRNRHNLVK